MPPSHVIGREARAAETGLELPARITSAAPVSGSSARGPGNASEVGMTMPVIVMSTMPASAAGPAQLCGMNRSAGTNAKRAPRESSQAREKVE